MWSLFTADFVIEIVGSSKYFLDRIRQKRGGYTPRVTTVDRDGKTRPRMNFEEAFGFAGYETRDPAEERERMRMRGAYDEENIRLAPYSHRYGGGGSGQRVNETDEEGVAMTPVVSHTSTSDPSSDIEPAHLHEGKRGSGGQVGMAI